MASLSIPIPTASSDKAVSRDNSDGRPLRVHARHLRHRSHHHHSRPANVAAAASLASSSMSPSSSTASSASSASSSSISASPSRIPRVVKTMSQPAAPADPPTPTQQKMAHNRRPSLLSDAISKQEAHVINIGDPDGPPRLITYLASSQGFTWNPEIFVPSYVDCDYTPLENRREPVVEIFLSDEEIDEMLPK